jgi:hypothetical protein
VERRFEGKKNLSLLPETEPGTVQTVVFHNQQTQKLDVIVNNFNFHRFNIMIYKNAVR